MQFPPSLAAVVGGGRAEKKTTPAAGKPGIGVISNEWDSANQDWDGQLMLLGLCREAPLAPLGAAGWAGTESPPPLLPTESMHGPLYGREAIAGFRGTLHAS